MIRPNLQKSLLAATAVAALTLTGCSGLGIGGKRVASAGDAAEARADGKSDKAVSLAEQAVQAAPSDAAAKAELGASYLAAGRFVSAQHAYDDALTLGDVSPRTALGFVLASIAVGDNRAAIDVLGEWRDAMSPADLGLAYALAGNPEMGVQVLNNALRGGENTPKMRQNLAYAYALGGNWAAARIIAAEDVAPGELDERISHWASLARPEDYAARVANLLGTTVQADAGMPTQLALGSGTTAEALIAEAAASASQRQASAGGELPPVDLLAVSGAARQLPPMDAPFGANGGGEEEPDFDSAFAGAGQPAAPARAVSNPVVQPTPVAAPRPAPTQAVARPAPKAEPARSQVASGSHLVQLGSYTSEAAAKRGWDIFAKRFPQISDREQVITRAKVRGRIYYRLSAGNLAAASARSLCVTVKAAGNGCIAWEESKPLPGTLDTGRRVASR